MSVECGGTAGHEAAGRVQKVLDAARVPHALQPQTFGLWTIERVAFSQAAEQRLIGWPDYTLLRRLTLGTLHRAEEGGEVVMEDSQRELRKHLPIWRVAAGHVLVTGLGLGCVVRGLLAIQDVAHIDVLELDRDILARVGAEFAREKRVTLYQADAFQFPVPRRRTWDYAWHDIWAEEHLHVLHAALLTRFHRACGVQGAWQFPRDIQRLWPWPLLGGPRRRRSTHP